MGLVDVREVAQAHLKAIEVEEAANQRFILNSNELWLSEIGKELQEEFQP